ncbi:endonuclease [Actinidia rufa]|uniref:Endonuclease n=1 Tax=Actinidia rufa TaxID=165716 RepID=A0A7J0ETU1_9ERIC|nr:endonuclease [Actinidia rufa]
MQEQLGSTSVVAYHKVIDVLSKAQEIELGESLMKEFTESGLKPLMPSFIILSLKLSKEQREILVGLLLVWLHIESDEERRKHAICFEFNQFWPKGGQPVIPKLIHRWLSPRVLAYWYMFAGYRTSSGDIFFEGKRKSRGC